MTTVPSTQKQLATALAYFVLMVLLANLMHWDIADIAWSIWLSSFVLALISVTAGSVFFFWLLEIKEPTEEQKASPNYAPMGTEGNIFSTLFIFAAELVPIVLLNAVVVMQLDEVLPLPAELTYTKTPLLDSFALDMLLAALYITLKEYWLFLLVSLWAPLHHYYQLIQQKMYEQEETQTNLILKPHYDTFRVQGFMLLLMLISYLANEFLLYWVLLLFYFFPWSLLWVQLKTQWQQKQQTKKQP